MRRGREFWAEHVATWRGSGLSLVAYSARHNLAKGTLGWWSWKLKGEAVGHGDLVELPPARRASVAGSPRRPIELVVEGRYLVRVWPGTVEADIREVVAALEQRG